MSLWDELPQDSIDKVALSFVKRVQAQACGKADAGHFDLKCCVIKCVVLTL